ncbi:hypothetical protein QFZ76_006018 [Streptomyces sp. V4I2]|nr:hypothetical protein [Streptomyces sp. V4I2]
MSLRTSVPMSRSSSPSPTPACYPLLPGDAHGIGHVF